MRSSFGAVVPNMYNTCIIALVNKWRNLAWKNSSTRLEGIELVLVSKRHVGSIAVLSTI